MKFIVVNDTIYSLENIRRVTSERKSDSNYSTFIIFLHIEYTDGTRLSIHCGRASDGMNKADELFKTITNILSGCTTKEDNKSKPSTTLSDEYNEIMDIIDKMEFFNQTAAYELFVEKSKELQRIDINGTAYDLKRIRNFIDKQYDIITSNPDKSYAESFYDKLDSNNERINRYKLEGIKEFWAELEKRNTLDERLRSVETGNKIIEEMENKVNV